MHVVDRTMATMCRERLLRSGITTARLPAVVTDSAASLNLPQFSNLHDLHTLDNSRGVAVGDVEWR